MTETLEDKRSKRIAIRLNQSVADKFEKYASELGIAPSTLGAFVVGEYVRSQDRQVENIKALRDLFPSSIQDVMTMELNKLLPLGSEDSPKQPEDTSELPFSEYD